MASVSFRRPHRPSWSAAVVSPLDEISRRQSRELEVAARTRSQLQHAQTAARLWAAYQPDYERYLPATAGDRGPS